MKRGAASAIRARIGSRLALASSRRTASRFHRLYYEVGKRGGTWKDTRWLGVVAYKSPLDLWVYQEILHEVRPQLIVETGTAHGGSALYLASICDLLGDGEVVTIDVAEGERPAHPRISYLRGSSVSGDVVAAVRARAEGRSPVMVVLDSDHREDHVLGELRAYADLVTPGSYLIVEDTSVNGNPVEPAFGPGPMEAVRTFLREDRRFEVDRTREKLLMTFNPGGFLKRIR